MRSLVLSVLVAACLAMPAAADPLPRGPVLISAPLLAGHMARVPGIWQCTPAERQAYMASGLPMGDSLETVRAINGHVRRMMGYRREPADAWHDHALAILTGRRASGDCEDYAITAITMALCAGVAPERIGIALSGTGSTSRLTNIDHALAFYDSGTAVYGFADTRVRGVRPIRGGSHGVIIWQTAGSLQRDPKMFYATSATPRMN